MFILAFIHPFDRSMIEKQDPYYQIGDLVKSIIDDTSFIGVIIEVVHEEHRGFPLYNVAWRRIDRPGTYVQDLCSGLILTDYI